MIDEKAVITRITGVVENMLADTIADLTRKRFTGIFTIRLECLFNQGGLRSTKQKITKEETIKVKEDP